MINIIRVTISFRYQKDGCKIKSNEVYVEVLGMSKCSSQKHTKLKVGKELHDFAKTKHLFLNNSITYVMS